MRRPPLARLALWLTALVLACGGHTTERGRADFERMRRQQRVDPYGSSATFANDMAMRSPPESTLSREDFLLGDSVASGVHAGTSVSRLPIAVTQQVLERGQHDYQIYCAACHASTPGTESVVGMNLDPPPPSLFGDSARILPAGEVFAIISRGHGRMPAYDWALPALERWDIIAYVQSRQESRR